LLEEAMSLGHWQAPEFRQCIADLVGPAARRACRVLGNDPRNHEIMVMHRRTEEQDIFFLTSGAKTNHTASVVFDAPGIPMQVETITGRLLPTQHTRENGECRIELSFDFAKSHVVCFKRSRRASLPIPEVQVSQKTLCRPGDPLPYQIDRDNALILDRGELFIDGRSVGTMSTLDAEQALARHGNAPQAFMRFTAMSEVKVAGAELLLETPESFEIKVDDRVVPVPTQPSWLIDPCLRRIPIPGGLKAGVNTIEIHFRWQQGLEIEPMYLLGRFGVYVEGDKCRIAPLPKKLAVGSWHDQGLAFYAGAATYALDAHVDIPADRWELRCPKFHSATRVSVNGADAGHILWAPYTLDITAHLRRGRNQIALQVANCLRNFLGPHHMGNEDEIDCLGPHNFFNTKHRVPEYRFKPAGLLGEVVLTGYRTDR